ncbi:hypothetical protein [Glycomyces sp. NPDC047010]|uniref:ATP-dependent DNA ligase n=1 Tax=Glycomyces sp. NPDC047010 TaxID=3155023 RepID=UPI003402A7B3
MLPVPGPPPTRGGWSYEREHGGVRVVAGARDGRWRMLTRYGTDLADRFPELGGIADLRGTALDGELVLSPTAARRLYTDPAEAARLAHAYPAAVVVFDVLALNSVDVRHEPYIYRRIVLDSLGLGGDNWCTRPWTSDPPADPQGTLAKRLDSPYLSGRSQNWRRLHPARRDAGHRRAEPPRDSDESRLRPVW